MWLVEKTVVFTFPKTGSIHKNICPKSVCRSPVFRWSHELGPSLGIQPNLLLLRLVSEARTDNYRGFTPGRRTGFTSERRSLSRPYRPLSRAGTVDSGTGTGAAQFGRPDAV